MRIVLTADWHLSELHQDWLFEATQKSIQDVFDIYRKNNCEYLCICGDVTHDKSYVYNSSMSYLTQLIEDNQDISFGLLIGNHDYAGSTKNHGLKLLAQAYDNVDVLDEICEKEIDGYKFVFLPHSKSIAEDVLNLSGDVLISHFGLNEAKIYAGLSINSKITVSQLNRFKRVFLGHYHYAQKIKRKTIQVYYTGSIVPLTWNEKNQGKKSVCILDTQDLSVEQAELPNSIELIEYVIEKNEDVEKILEKKQEQKELGNIVRVKSLVKLDDELLEEVIYEQTDANIIEEFTNINEQNILAEYLNKIEVPKHLEVEKLLKYGTEILEKAKSSIEDLAEIETV